MFFFNLLYGQIFYLGHLKMVGNGEKIAPLFGLVHSFESSPNCRDDILQLYQLMLGVEKH